MLMVLIYYIVIISDNHNQILPAAALTAVEVAKGLRQRGIIIRYFGSQGGALYNYIRISSSLPWHTEKIIHALAQLILPPQKARLQRPPPPFTFANTLVVQYQSY